jgi:hypothetical protein
MGAECFLWLLVSRIYGYEGLGFQGVDNKVIKLFNIISCISDEDDPCLKGKRRFSFFMSFLATWGSVLLLGRVFSTMGIPSFETMTWVR